MRRPHPPNAPSAAGSYFPTFVLTLFGIMVIILGLHDEMFCFVYLLFKKRVQETSFAHRKSGLKTPSIPPFLINWASSLLLEGILVGAA